MRDQPLFLGGVVDLALGIVRQALIEDRKQFRSGLAGGTYDEDVSELRGVLFIAAVERGFDFRRDAARLRLLLSRPLVYRSLTDLGVGGESLQPILPRAECPDSIRRFLQFVEIGKGPEIRHALRPVGRAAAPEKIADGDFRAGCIERVESRFQAARLRERTE